VIGTNVNDILRRTLETGTYEVRSVAATTSPSMDIQVSSNFERLLFEEGGRDAGAVTAMMDGLRQSGTFTLPEGTRGAIARLFDAATTNEEQVAETMRATLAGSGYLLDPHTAVAMHAAHQGPPDPAVPMVVLSTAHPAKFPEAVAAITGVHPVLPQRLSRLMTDTERMTPLPADVRAVAAQIAAAIGMSG